MSRKGSKTEKVTKSKRYYGIGNKPKGMNYGNAQSSLNKKQVRRYGEYEIPHPKMIAYLKARGLPPPDYAKYGVKSKGGSKSVKKVVKGSNKRGKPLTEYQKFVATHKKKGVTMAQVAAKWRAKKGK
jgi:hypothetical protein